MTLPPKTLKKTMPLLKMGSKILDRAFKEISFL